MHEAMVELGWTPRQIGELTIPQLVCLLKKQPPTGRGVETIDDYMIIAERDVEAERAWCH